MDNDLLMEEKTKIVRIIGHTVFHREYFYDADADEVFYWQDYTAGLRVVTTFDDFLNQAHEKEFT